MHFFSKNEKGINGKFTKTEKYYNSLTRLLLGKYPHIHRLQIIYIDKKSHQIYITPETHIETQPLNTNSIIRFITNLWDKVVKTFEVDATTIANIQEIVKVKNDEKTFT